MILKNPCRSWQVWQDLLHEPCRKSCTSKGWQESNIIVKISCVPEEKLGHSFEPIFKFKKNLAGSVHYTYRIYIYINTNMLYIMIRRWFITIVCPMTWVKLLGPWGIPDYIWLCGYSRLRRIPLWRKGPIRVAQKIKHGRFLNANQYMIVKANEQKLHQWRHLVSPPR